MKTFGPIVLLLAVAVFPFLRASAATEESLVVQRADGCVVMDAGQGQVEGNRSTFGFVLTHPGAYTVQVITRIEDSIGNASATVDVDVNAVEITLEAKKTTTDRSERQAE